LHGKMYMVNISIKDLFVFPFLVIPLQQLVSSCLIFCGTLSYSLQNLALNYFPDTGNNSSDNYGETKKTLFKKIVCVEK